MRLRLWRNYGAPTRLHRFWCRHTGGHDFSKGRIHCARCNVLKYKDGDLR